MLEPVVGSGAGLASFFWFHCGTVSHRLFSLGSDGVNVALGAGVGVGVARGAGDRFGFGFGFGFGIGTDLSALPGCSG